MKILWLATCDSFYELIQSKSNISNNNDGGWYLGLHQAILKYEKQNDFKLGIAFTCNKEAPFKTCIDNCIYYPLIRPKESIINKILHYLLRKTQSKKLWSEDIEKIIDDFQPDLIHFFGIESQMAYYLKKAQKPTVINLLGIINPCYNAFLPIGMNEYSIKRYNRTFRELILNNQYRYAYKNMKARAREEIKLFSYCKNIAGRTYWDKTIANLYAPQANYYTINEILRPIFMNLQNGLKKIEQQ